MVHEKFKQVAGLTWEEAATKSNQLFFEADRLDAKAYSLLREETLSPEVWNEFSAAKRKAEKKYLEARMEWQRIKSILGSLDKSAGKQSRQVLH